MGRGRGKKKPPVVSSHDGQGSGGEEPLPAYKRSGRLRKQLKDDINEDVAEKVEEEEGDIVKPSAPVKEKKAAAADIRKKRKRNSQAKENSNSDLLDDGKVFKTNAEASTTPNGYRQNGNRRKSKPRRAADAGVVC